jgi:hypothetical protein
LEHPQHVAGVGVDGVSNVYAAGWFRGMDVFFGGTAFMSSAAGSLFLAKYDPAGMLSGSVKEIGYTVDAQITALAVSESGNIAIAGLASGPGQVNFGNNKNLTTNFSKVLFVAFYDTNLDAHSTTRTSTRSGSSARPRRVPRPKSTTSPSTPCRATSSSPARTTCRSRSARTSYTSTAPRTRC